MVVLTEELKIEKKVIEQAGRMHWVHWLVVILSLILTLSAWYISKKTIEEKNKIQFERQANQVIELISERMQKYEDGLWGGVSAIKMNGNKTSYTDWKTFADSLRMDTKYPGINGIGIIYYITPDGLKNYLKEQQQERPDFFIHPQHNKDALWPITYIEPFKGNEKAVGLDIAHETNRYKAAVKARNTGRAKITGPITLVQDSEKTPGFLFYAPFYKGLNNNTIDERKENFIGMVYAPFVVKKLMEGTLQTDKRNVGLKITDENQVLYDEHKENPSTHHALYSKKMELNLYGRVWVFDIWSKESFHQSTANNQPIIILVGGILIDSLLLTLFILLASSNQRAIRLIKKMTDDG